LVTGSEISVTDPVGGSSASVGDAPSGEAIGLEIGNFAPDFDTVNVEGEPIALSSLRGKVVLLNFWATWCGPCRIEMPGFERQYRNFSDQGFIVLAVNNAESVEIAAAFRDQLRLTFPIALDQSGDIQRQ